MSADGAAFRAMPLRTRKRRGRQPNPWPALLEAMNLWVLIETVRASEPRRSLRELCGHLCKRRAGMFGAPTALRIGRNGKSEWRRIDDPETLRTYYNRINRMAKANPKLMKELRDSLAVQLEMLASIERATAEANR